MFFFRMYLITISIIAVILPFVLLLNYLIEKMQNTLCNTNYKKTFLTITAVLNVNVFIK